jgi:hypothetical protein
MTPRDISRRRVIGLLAAAPLAQFAIACSDVEKAAQQAADSTMASGAPDPNFKPAFFTADEWPQVRMLADMIIPKDDRSGSATDAAVPEFLDFMMGAYPYMQDPMRTGLAWLDSQSLKRYSQRFVDASPEQRAKILDDIAWEDRALGEMKPGAEFFARFRNLTASGFWSSRIGWEDLEYQGNRALTSWDGCPPAALAKMGVSYNT